MARKEIYYFDAIISVTSVLSVESPKQYQVYTLGTADRGGEKALMDGLHLWCQDASKNDFGLRYRLEELDRAGNLDAVIAELVLQGLVLPDSRTARLRGL